jgi:sulfhydrogenase subunit alpha
MSMSRPSSRTRTIRVDYLARVEGEGSLFLKVKGDEVLDARLNIFEPPRFFEAFLRGRRFTEAPDITARICGICPIAYQMGASHAMEDACGVVVPEAIRDLRHLIYCGEWIESHALHVFMLHLPDFLGYDDAIRMARDHGDAVKRGLRMKQIGNQLMTLLGGREIHPINPRVGGFYRAPTRAELAPMEEPLAWCRDAAIETLKLVSGLTYPDFERDYLFVALRHPSEYAILDGRLVSSQGLDIAISEYADHFVEEHAEHTTALQSVTRDGLAYKVGPLARYSLNFDRLAPAAQNAALEHGPGPVCRNPFKSIQVRLIEIIHACEVALDLIGRYRRPEAPFVEVAPRAGTGYGCTEAPRGICWHHYDIDAEGLITHARIVPPTSQNQRTIENDLRLFVQQNLHLGQEDLQWKCEQGVRNYDPCISCACHFLKLHIEHA